MDINKYLSNTEVWIPLPLTQQEKDALNISGKPAPEIHIKLPDQETFEDYQERCQTKELVGQKGKKRRMMGQSQIDRRTKNAELAQLLANHVDDWRNFEDADGQMVPFNAKQFKGWVRFQLGYWLIQQVTERIVVVSDEEEEAQNEEEVN